jgi:lipoprotein-anchoring transpeptidase ErfK/SrfK
MRFYRISLPLVLGIIALSTLPVEGQDGLLSRLFSASKKESSETRGKRSIFGGPKRVEINLTDQKLRAYEGNRLVMQTHISSGRNGATPTGRFSAGYKDADHYSSLYHNAPMPWSVQVHGNIFIHGFTSVPDYPASHGCIRMPLTGNNPAKRFFQWVDPGTPIRIDY